MNVWPGEVLGERSWAVKDETDQTGWVQNSKVSPEYPG